MNEYTKHQTNISKIECIWMKISKQYLVNISRIEWIIKNRNNYPGIGWVFQILNEYFWELKEYFKHRMNISEVVKYFKHRMNISEIERICYTTNKYVRDWMNIFQTEYFKNRIHISGVGWIFHKLNEYFFKYICCSRNWMNTSNIEWNLGNWINISHTEWIFQKLNEYLKIELIFWKLS